MLYNDIVVIFLHKYFPFLLKAGASTGANTETTNSEYVCVGGAGGGGVWDEEIPLKTSKLAMRQEHSLTLWIKTVGMESNHVFKTRPSSQEEGGWH